MAKKPDLMRQKVNVTPGTVKSWEDEFRFFHRQPIHVSLLSVEDLTKTFTHQDREFTLIGMTANGHCMVTENVDGQLIYWECTRHFVQFKWERKNYQWVEIAGIRTTVPKDYETHKLNLPPIKATRKKPQQEEPAEELDTVEYSEKDHSNT